MDLIFKINKIFISLKKIFSNFLLRVYEKILYFVQIFFLKEKGVPAFGDDVEAWKYGPVVPSVYAKFASFGGLSIDINEADGKQAECEISDSDRNLIEVVLEESGKYSLYELVKITQTHWAWREAFQRYKPTMTIDSILKQERILRGM